MESPFTTFEITGSETDPRFENLLSRAGWYAEHLDWTLDMGLVYGPFPTREGAEAYMQDFEANQARERAGALEILRAVPHLDGGPR